MSVSDPSLDTLLAQGGHFIDAETGAIVPPIQPATTYARDEGYGLRGFGYSRNANPTGRHVEGVLAKLEGAEDALVFASGMAGIVTLFETLESGDRVVAPRVMYHGSADWLRHLAERRGIDLAIFDASDPASLDSVLRAGETSLVWIEPSVNPTWDVIDVRAAAEAAHSAGALLGVDATVTPPVTLRALDLGADIVFHSGTKYLAGHSDLTAGVLATRSADARWEDIRPTGHGCRQVQEGIHELRVHRDIDVRPRHHRDDRPPAGDECPAPARGEGDGRRVQRLPGRRRAEKRPPRWKGR